ncbi:MAG: DivIVA domain-containing protein [candidate division WOR-3 bacterium]
MAKKEKKEKKPEATAAPAAPSKLTPVDIRRATFGSGFGGFKKSEVQAFLERVAKSMEEVLRDKRTLEEQMGELRAQLAIVDELKAERDKMDEQMFLLTSEIETYKKELEVLRAGGINNPETKALRQENEILRQECESLRAQLEMTPIGGDPAEIEALKAEIRNLKAQLEETRSVAAGPAETISLAKNVADQIRAKAREEARQTLMNAMRRIEELLNELS